MLTSKNKMLRILTGIACAATLCTTTYFSLAQAYPMGSDSHNMSRSEKMHDYLQTRLNRLAERLEIKSSQQAAWDEYSSAVSAMTEQNVAQPADAADAAAIARYRADRAAELSGKMSKIADATSNLQSVLTEEQRKTFNTVVARNMHGGGHSWGHGKSCNGKQRDDKSWQDNDKS